MTLARKSAIETINSVSFVRFTKSHFAKKMKKAKGYSLLLWSFRSDHTHDDFMRDSYVERSAEAEFGRGMLRKQLVSSLKGLAK